MNDDMPEVNGSTPPMLPGSFLREKEPGYEANIKDTCGSLITSLALPPELSASPPLTSGMSNTQKRYWDEPVATQTNPKRLKADSTPVTTQTNTEKLKADSTPVATTVLWPQE